MAKKNNAPKMEKRIVTEDDLVANPELADQEIKVGDEIEVPTVPETEGSKDKKTEEKKDKKTEEKKDKKTLVVFVKHYMPYAIGDVVGYSKKEAGELVKLGVAEIAK